jgi:hypothetical protein
VIQELLRRLSCQRFTSQDARNGGFGYRKLHLPKPIVIGIYASSHKVIRLDLNRNVSQSSAKSEIEELTPNERVESSVG